MEQKHSKPVKHYVVDRTDLKVGQQVADFTGAKEFETLTAARKAVRAGQAIVRAPDSIVVSVR